MRIIENKSFDEERTLYGATDVKIKNCVFSGPADGESALKESRKIEVESCRFELRYPLWHVTDGKITDCALEGDCRASMWYDRDLSVADSNIDGVKAVRECDDITIENCDITSTEFGWFCRGVKISESRLQSEYPFLRSKDIVCEKLSMRAKYSFQYTENVTVDNCVFDTKDAFWHAKNVTVRNSEIKGEYIGWYSENLRFENCVISGTQPFCYAKGLVLENCELTGADLAFEKSSVTAELCGSLISVKNPLSGRIIADGIGEVILDCETGCEIIARFQPAIQ